MQSVISITGRPPIRNDTYVTLGDDFMNTRRLGNQMFNLAALVYVASLKGRLPALEPAHVNYMDHMNGLFNLTAFVRITKKLCPCYEFTERTNWQYDDRVEDLGQPGHEESYTARTLVLHGYYQSWLYTRSMEAPLRRIFSFSAEVQSFAETFLESSLPPGWTLGFTRVGSVAPCRGSQQARLHRP